MPYTSFMVGNRYEKMKENCIIQVEHVTKKFKEETVLDDISLTFETGKIHGIIGRNGCGKTMLMKCICGFVIPTSGEITVGGKIVGKEVDIPKELGIIIETPGFIQNYSGYQNLKLLAMVRSKIGKEEIIEAMQMVGLDSKSKKHVGKYSLGMRQKLGLAQAIMEKPSILILDEPMNGLDNQSVEDMRKVLKRLSEEGTTILIASHNQADIDVLCDSICKMDQGKIID